MAGSEGAVYFQWIVMEINIKRVLTPTLGYCDVKIYLQYTLWHHVSMCLLQYMLLHQHSSLYLVHP